MPNLAYALVDYDNQRPPRFGHRASEGRRPNLRDHEDYLTALVRGLLELRDRLAPDFLELRVRLYGGWISTIPGERTEAGDMVSQAIMRLGHSTRVPRTRLFLQLAESLLTAPDELLIGTFRSSRWRGEVLRFLAQPPECPDSPTACSLISAFSRWSRGRCPRSPACSVHTAQVVSTDSQKLVDAMLIADTISGAVHERAHVLLVSMDDDMVPGALSARVLGGDITVVRFGRRDPSGYDTILRRNGVQIIDLPPFGV
jgi:hypothetical protein